MEKQRTFTFFSRSVNDLTELGAYATPADQVRVDSGPTSLPIQLANGNEDYHPYESILDDEDEVERGARNKRHAVFLFPFVLQYLMDALHTNPDQAEEEAARINFLQSLGFQKMPPMTENNPKIERVKRTAINNSFSIVNDKDHFAQENSDVSFKFSVMDSIVSADPRVVQLARGSHNLENVRSKRAVFSIVVAILSLVVPTMVAVAVEVPLHFVEKARRRKAEEDMRRALKLINSRVIEVSQEQNDLYGVIDQLVQVMQQAGLTKKESSEIASQLLRGNNVQLNDPDAEAKIMALMVEAKRRALAVLKKRPLPQVTNAEAKAEMERSDRRRRQITHGPLDHMGDVIKAVHNKALKQDTEIKILLQAYNETLIATNELRRNEHDRTLYAIGAITTVFIVAFVGFVVVLLNYEFFRNLFRV